MTAVQLVSTVHSSGHDIAVVIVFEGSDTDADAYRREHDLHQFLFVTDTSGRLLKVGKVRVAPFAISVDADWKVYRKGHI